MEIVEIYKQLLATAGMSADEEGFISLQLARTEKTPVLVKGKRLVLPTHAQLTAPGMSNRVFFHPLNESILRGESDVLTSFREHLNKRANFVLAYIAINLLVLATSVADHKHLTPDQTIFMDKLKNADEGTIERMKKITEQMMVGDEAHSFAHIFIKRQGRVKDRKHLRVGVVSFPFYEELKKEHVAGTPNEVYGVKLRKADRENFIGLLEYMIPNIGDPESYFCHSDQEVAPSLDALMRTIIKIGDPINAILDLFKDRIEGYEDLYFNGDWEDVFSDLAKLKTKIQMIPMQAGNEGSIPNTGGAPAVEVGGVRTTRSGTQQQETPAAPSATAYRAPPKLGMTTAEAAALHAGGGTGLSAPLAEPEPQQQVPVSVPVHPAMRHQYQQPAPYQPYPNNGGYQAPTPTVAPGVHPALAAAGAHAAIHGYHGGGYGGYTQQQQHVPRFAQQRTTYGMNQQPYGGGGYGGYGNGGGYNRGGGGSI